MLGYKHRDCFKFDFFSFELLQISIDSMARIACTTKSLLVITHLFCYQFQTHGDPVMKESLYTVSKIYGNVACSNDIPSEVLTERISKIKCALQCSSESSCQSVNWKEPSTCELFYFDPPSRSITNTCSYFSKGEIVFFHSILIRNECRKIVLRETMRVIIGTPT